MAKQIVMDITGDTRHEFDPADAHAVAEAFARFEALTSEGFTAAVRTGSGTSELIHDFDPAGPTAIPSLRTGCRPPRRTRGVSLYSRERRRRGKQLPVDLLALMNSLYDRRQMAVVVPYEPTSMKSDSPREGECHNNADRYVLENPDCQSTRGWLVFDNATASVFSSRPHFRFTSHSVVERADGRLFDPTPTQASQRYPFLRHEGPESEFDAIIAVGYTQLDYPV